VIRPFAFPFPHVYDGVRVDGSALAWPDVCNRCKARPCEAAPHGDASLCRYGVNYQKIDDHMLVAGVILANWTYSTPARSMRLRGTKGSIVQNALFKNAVDAYKNQIQTDFADVERENDLLLQEYAGKEAFKPAFINQVKADIVRGLAFVHDYKQINAQISQNINVVLESRYEGATLEEKLQKAHRSEKAIYEASKFLEEKLNVAKFLVNPDWLYVQDECVRFRVHGMVMKYRQIYQSWFDAKRVRISVAGTSYNEILANPQASAVIPHTLIDNALKYTRVGGEVEIFVQDEGTGVAFEVSSHGPRILPEEQTKIFLPFFRGQHAREHSEEGAGYGLYLAQLVAKVHLGTEITVEQSSEPEGQMGYRTTFALTFPSKAAILP